VDFCGAGSVAAGWDGAADASPEPGVWESNRRLAKAQKNTLRNTKRRLRRRIRELLRSACSTSLARADGTKF
jgi:hypothetical protein